MTDDDLNQIPGEVFVLANVAVHADPEIQIVLPPDDICADLRAIEAGMPVSEAVADWLIEQRGWQGAADALWDELTASGELVDPARRGFPGWYTNWWAPVLRMPWSRRLAEAVTAAADWQ